MTTPSTLSAGSQVAYLPRFERTSGVSFLLTERDIEILKAVNRYRYLKTGQIKRLVFPDNTSLQSTRRRLRYLYHNAYINRLVPYVRAGHGGEEVAYYLDRKGEQTLEDLGIAVLRPTKTGQVRPTFLLHALALSEFRVSLELAIQSREDIGLHRFVCDFELKSHIARKTGQQDHRLFEEVQHPTTKKNYVVYPDGLIILKATASSHQALYFLEIDRGTEGLRRIQDKFIGYLLYRQQGRFQKYGTFARFRVLFQTTSDKRAQNMAAALHDYEESDMVRITTEGQVTESTILTGSIWKNTAGKEGALLKSE